MTLYLYRVGTAETVLTIQNVQSYTAEQVTALNEDGTMNFYSSLAEDCELSSRADCTETLRADYRAAHPMQETRINELEALVAELLYGGEGE